MSCANCSSGKNGTPPGCKSHGHCATGGCNKLPVYDWLTGVPLAHGQQIYDAVEVRFKNTRKGFYRNANNLSLLPGEVVTVEGGPGHDLGMVSLTGELVRAQMQRKGTGNDTFELRKVLRKSTQEDIDRWHEVRARENDTLLAARGVLREQRMPMKLTDVEYQGDGTKATFFYTAEERVDFRDLLRLLAAQFHVRIEMKQIGARQEAGRIGGIGSCGRELCCATWLTDFRSVTTSAARYQQLALNPQKLAGQCGKLKCCLNYELDMYIEAVKSYPSQNAKLKTRQGTGAHMKTDIFEEKMWYLFKSPGSTPVMAGFPVETVREILVQNKQGIEPEVDLHMQEKEEAAAAPEHDYKNVVGQDELTRFDEKGRGGKGRKRGGRDRHKGRGQGHQQAQGQRPGPAPGEAPSASPRPGGDGGHRRDKRGRGRDRRGPKPDNRPGGPGPKPPAA